jgi:uncharacterized protein YyaL (SSP411 family)
LQPGALPRGMRWFFSANQEYFARLKCYHCFSQKFTEVVSERAPMNPKSEQKPNRLIHEASPYLLQHAYNPVDWHPWDQQALDLSRKLDRPIFLSIGYAACHWCHVMEHESFENLEVAQLLNENFVPIKVDREERPDLDEIYMNATVLYTRGSGGWPMSVFLTPAMQPFFAGTYFPLLDIDGRPGFLTLLRRIIDTWRLQREDLARDAGQITGMIGEMTAVAKGDMVSRADVAQAVSRIAAAYDMRSGGLSSGNNKFPPSMSMDLLLREHHKTGDSRLLQAVEVTLENMAQGGIFDHLGGGICRYSTDPEWLCRTSRRCSTTRRWSAQFTWMAIRKPGAACLPMRPAAFSIT